MHQHYSKLTISREDFFFELFSDFSKCLRASFTRSIFGQTCIAGPPCNQFSEAEFLHLCSHFGLSAATVSRLHIYSPGRYDWIIFSLNRAKKWFRANYVRAFALCGSTCVHKTVFMWLCGLMVCDHVAILLYGMWPCDHFTFLGYVAKRLCIWLCGCLKLCSVHVYTCYLCR